MSCSLERQAAGMNDETALRRQPAKFFINQRKKSLEVFFSVRALEIDRQSTLPKSLEEIMKKTNSKPLSLLTTFALMLVSVSVVTPNKGVGIASPLPSRTDDSSIETFTTIDVPGATGTLALDINSQGMVVGRYGSGGTSHGFLYSPTGEIVTIDFPGSSFTVAASINDRGDIVGMYALPSAPTQRHGYLLKDGVYTSFDPPGSTFTNALGINERGDIVGRCRVPGGDFHGFLLSDGEFTIIDAPGALRTHLFKMNSRGQAIGGFVNSANQEELLIWEKNRLTMMTLPNGRPVALDNGGINERGDVVGTYCDTAVPCGILPTGNHGFLISGGEFTTIDLPGAVSTATLGINARGDIVGAYFNSTGGAHGFVLTR
jgi:uncharacterized membrane protein